VKSVNWNDGFQRGMSMKVRQRIRLKQKRRWRPSLYDLVGRTIRKNLPDVFQTMARCNPLFKRLRQIDG
jgi:hypothetical protein